MKLRNSDKFIFLLLIIATIISLQTTLIRGQNSEKLSISFKKNLGSNFGGNWSGDFTIKCAGDEDIVALELFFNGTQVASALSNFLEYRFHTEDFGDGIWNITLKGNDGSGVIYQTTLLQNFLKPDIKIISYILIITFVVTLIGVGLYRDFKDKRKPKKTPEEIKKRIRIDIDNDLQKNF